MKCASHVLSLSFLGYKKELMSPRCKRRILIPHHSQATQTLMHPPHFYIFIAYHSATSSSYKPLRRLSTRLFSQTILQSQSKPFLYHHRPLPAINMTPTACPYCGQINPATLAYDDCLTCASNTIQEVRRGRTSRRRCTLK